MITRSVARYVHLSPRKASLVMRELSGRSVEPALLYLQFSPKAASREITKVVKSAAANATTNHKLDSSRLVIKRALADQGPSGKRWRPASRGRAHPFRRPTTHLLIEVEEAPAPAVPVIERKPKTTAQPARAVSARKRSSMASGSAQTKKEAKK